MFDSTKQKPNCNFAEDVVSYIYDEMKSSEKTDFETHLENCTPCTDEIAAFSSVSFSIKEWRDETFANLETPKIVIPYETAKPEHILVETTEEKVSWLSSLSGLFNLSPVFLRNATAFGTVALLVGLVWFFVASTSTNTDSIATATNDTDKKQTDSTKVVNNENVPPTNQVIAKNAEQIGEVDNSAPKQEVLVANSPKTTKSKTFKAKSVNIRKNKVTKIRKKSKRKTNNKRVTPKQKKVEPQQIQEIPRLTDFAMDEAEDDDLQLTDFFGEDESGD